MCIQVYIYVYIYIDTGVQIQKFMRSKEMSDFLGETALSRPEVQKRIWAYAKAGLPTTSAHPVPREPKFPRACYLF